MNDELTDIEQEDINKDNKYLNYKQFDMAEIFAYGNMPEFENETDGFMCARQAGDFIHSVGLINHDYIIAFMSAIKMHHRVIFLRQLKVSHINKIMANPKYHQMVRGLIGLI